MSTAISNLFPTIPYFNVPKKELLREVTTGRLLGMLEVDIRVPEIWSDRFSHPTMTPSQYFEKMSPLFCTKEVPYDIIGEYMQEHVRRFGLSKKPRRLLVGGMKARQLLIATPLLKWHLEHGLEVTKIYQVIEYAPQRCFHEFVEVVSEDRRQKDTDPNKAIIGGTAKVRGNSSFGSTIVDQEKFQSVQYVQGENRAMRQANLPQFKRLTILLDEEQYYEIEKSKPELRIYLPIQIGYFISQYAKLHMLQFYYDFFDKFIDRADFHYFEIDTDSAYLALSAPRLIDVIKPYMLPAYTNGLEGCCRDEIVEACSVTLVSSYLLYETC